MSSARVDVVVVSYNSASRLRQCIAPLVLDPDIQVTVVDNNSHDDSVAIVSDLPAVRTIALDENVGFGSGCNRGWRSGSAPFVLFINPDARMTADDVQALTKVLERTSAGAVAPRIVDESGTTEWSLRRFPEIRSIFGQAFFAHRVFRNAAWADEVIRDPARYEQEGPCEWASGACLLVRRTLLEQIDGFDERFFMYCEDIDLCQRLWAAGAPVVYAPTVACTHAGGASAPRWRLQRILATSRVQYGRKHFHRGRALLFQIGVGLNAFMHLIFGRGLRGRLGHGYALLATLGIDALLF